MNQSLNLMRDLDFKEAAESANTLVGGLSIVCRPIHGDTDWGGCFPLPRPLPRPLPHPRPFPISEWPLPKPMPWPAPKHPPIELYAMS